jgi:translation initiation factor IF-2
MPPPGRAPPPQGRPGARGATAAGPPHRPRRGRVLGSGGGHPRDGISLEKGEPTVPKPTPRAGRVRGGDPPLTDVCADESRFGRIRSVLSVPSRYCALWVLEGTASWGEGCAQRASSTARSPGALGPGIAPRHAGRDSHPLQRGGPKEAPPPHAVAWPPLKGPPSPGSGAPPGPGDGRGRAPDPALAPGRPGTREDGAPARGGATPFPRGPRPGPGKARGGPAGARRGPGGRADARGLRSKGARASAYVGGGMFQCADGPRPLAGPDAFAPSARAPHGTSGAGTFATRPRPLGEPRRPP